jgi:hypothetical protein
LRRTESNQIRRPLGAFFISTIVATLTNKGGSDDAGGDDASNGGASGGSGRHAAGRNQPNEKQARLSRACSISNNAENRAHQ